MEKEVDWIAEKGGIALLITRPDYICFHGRYSENEYPADLYLQLLNHLTDRYGNQYYHLLPKELTDHWKRVSPLIVRSDGRMTKQNATMFSRDTESIREVNRDEPKIRTCLIAYTFYEVDFRVKRYAEALLQAGYEVDVFALRRKGQKEKEIVNGVTVYHLQEREYNEKGLTSFIFRAGKFFVKIAFQVSFKCIKRKYKIIHVHNPPDFLVFATLLSRLFGSKIIFDMHENLPEFYCAKFDKSPNSFLAKVLLFFEKKGVRFADFIIVAHDLLRERVIKRDGIPEKNCAALLNYPSNVFFRPLPKKKEKEEFTILYPGTVSYQHGIDIALEAMAIVRKECKEAKLDIYVRSTNPTYYEELVKLTNRLNLNESVSFFEPVPMEEMGKILAGASIGVVPKRGGIFGSEAFSTKILEFMAAGIPVIASKTKIDEYYFDDSMIMFFQPENSVDLARCILELYRDGNKRKSLIKNGYEFIQKNNWEIKSQVYLDKVKDLIR